MKKQFLLFGLLIILFAACKKQSFNATKQAVIDDNKIQAYVAANHIPATKDPATGIYYQIITQIDTGEMPTLTDTVQVTYTGKLLNGTVFDTEVATNFPMSEVVPGWQDMLPKLKAKATPGGPYSRIRIIVPSALGYGSNSGGTIPANSVLDFTIDLIGFYPYIQQ